MQLNNNSSFDDLITYNKLGLCGKELESKMRELTKLRAIELKRDIAFWDFKDFSYAQYKQIHCYIFQDIFEWAGKDRYELGFSGKLSKYIIQFCRGDELESYADSIFSASSKITQTYLNNLHSGAEYSINISRKLYSKKLANLWSKLNFLHPFREGNGRTSRIFLEMFAKSLNINFDIDSIDRRKQVIALNRAMRGILQNLEELVFINIKQN
ncbi:Fic family protein [uncultured Brachyspira sp.]|mgnify:CR=1 FL=1|nr:Fic family protein [uncultured Brachyspira sp.]